MLLCYHYQQRLLTEKHALSTSVIDIVNTLITVTNTHHDIYRDRIYHTLEYHNTTASPAPKIWNSLPPALRMCTSRDTFRHQLKTHYFQQAFQPT